MRIFAVHFFAAAAKWLTLFVGPILAIDSVLNAEGGGTLKALSIAALAIVGAVFIAFRLEGLLLRLGGEEPETPAGNAQP